MNQPEIETEKINGGSGSSTIFIGIPDSVAEL